MSEWAEMYLETVRAAADVLGWHLDQEEENSRLAEVLEDVPQQEREKVLRMARGLAEDRIKRALEWRERLGIKAGNVLVDDASHVP